MKRTLPFTLLLTVSLIIPALPTALFFPALFQSVQAQVIPDDLVVDWSIAGLENGMPQADTTVSLSDFGAVGDGVADDRAALMNAMAALGGRQGIVSIPTGTFRMSTSVGIPSNVVLKGQGADQTRITFDLGGTGLDGFAISSFEIGDDILLNTAPAFGSNTIEVSDPATFTEGDWVEVVQDNGNWDTNPASWAEESIGHLARVIGISGNQILLNEQFNIDYELAKTPRVRIVEPKKNIGIECLSIERLGGGPTGSNIAFYLAVNSWVRGVESYKSCGAHVLSTRSAHLLITGSFFHEAWVYDGSGTRGYGVCLTRHTTACLIEDNVFRFLRHSMMVKQGANGNVFANNYSREPNRSEFIANYSGDISLHGHFAYANLFEGNVVSNIFTDDYWGPSGPLNTFFRNRASLYGVVMTSNGTLRQNYVSNEITNTSLLMGNFLLSPGGHFQLANLVRGNVVPPSSESVEDASLYRSNIPPYWENGLAWPAIGDGSGTQIPAESRWYSDDNPAYCQSGGCPAPQGLSVDDIQMSSATLSWDPVTGATRYQVRGRPLGGSSWSLIAVDGSQRSLDNRLAPARSYEWQVMARCSNSFSAPSEVQIFTTLGLREGELESTPELSAYPNPAQTDLRVDYEGEWKILDLSGRVMSSGIGASFIDVSAWTRGMYILEGQGERLLLAIR